GRTRRASARRPGRAPACRAETWGGRMPKLGGLAWTGAGTVAAVLAVGAAGLSPAAAAGPVSAVPAAGTPQLAPTGTTTEQIRQLVACGGTVYAVGSFTSISQGGV